MKKLTKVQREYSLEKLYDATVSIIDGARYLYVNPDTDKQVVKILLLIDKLVKDIKK